MLEIIKEQEANKLLCKKREGSMFEQLIPRGIENIPEGIKNFGMNAQNVQGQLQFDQSGNLQVINPNLNQNIQMGNDNMNMMPYDSCEEKGNEKLNSFINNIHNILS